jgi:hypothetical protein
MSEGCGTLEAMADELHRGGATRTAGPAVEVLDPSGLAARAAEVASRQRSPETRRTYAAVYRTFTAFLGPRASPEDLTAQAVRSYRDQLERTG